MTAIIFFRSLVKKLNIYSDWEKAAVPHNFDFKIVIGDGSTVNEAKEEIGERIAKVFGSRIKVSLAYMNRQDIHI